MKSSLQEPLIQCLLQKKGGSAPIIISRFHNNFQMEYELNIDTYWWEEQAYMCHGYCEIGAQPLVWATDHIAQFLFDQANNVLIITFQSTLTAEQT